MMWRDAKRRPVTDAVNPHLTEGDWEPGAVQRWVVPIEPDRTVLMCEYCLCYIDMCYIDKSQDEACWNCGAYRVQGFALFMLGEGIGGDHE